MKRILWILILAVFTISGFAQVRIKTYLGSDTIRFAQKTTLHIDIAVPGQTPVLMPQMPDTLTRDLEISAMKADTTRHDNGLIYRFKIEIFGFRDTVFHIPAIPIRVADKLYYSDSTLRLVVLPIEIDSAQIARIDTSQVIDVFDVKEPIHPPLTLRELWLRYRYWLLALVLLALLACLAYWLYKKIKARRAFKQLPIEEQIEPHELALKRLKQLENRKLYQKGDFKEYYSELSEILREYIERRFYIRALESTTRELKILLEATDKIPSHLKMQLFELFELADLAKFAGYRPLWDVCQRHLSFAYDFVEQTKPRPEVEEETEQTQEIVNQENQEQ